MSDFKFRKTDMSQNVGNYSSRGTNLNDGRGNNCSQCIHNGNQRACKAANCNYNNANSTPDMYKTQTSVDKIRDGATNKNQYK